MKKIKKIKPADIVVGISTKNVDTTIVHVMNVASIGLTDFFPEYRSTIVVCDGFSNDRTRELAELFELPHQVSKIVMEQHGMGKGNAIRTIFEVALKAGADSVILLDGDLLSIRPEWIEHLGKPPIYGVADLVVPYYIRHKYDGLITNNLAYPLIRALYGIDLRQPISGEFGLSIELAKKLLSHPLFPENFGIDIFITTVAAAENLAIEETLLGLKLHESTMKYMDPRKLLLPMFSEVVSMILDLMMHYENVWRKKPVIKKVKRVMAKYHGQRPPPLSVNVEKVRRMFEDGYKSYGKFIRSITGNKIYNQLQRRIKRKVGIDAELWSKLVYALAASYRKRKQRMYVIDSLRTLWLGRFITYVEETKGMGVEEAEKILEEQAKIFERNRDYLISRY
jgi:hypothetical protein